MIHQGGEVFVHRVAQFFGEPAAILRRKMRSQTIGGRADNLEGHSVNCLTAFVFPALRPRTIRFSISGFQEKDRT